MGKKNEKSTGDRQRFGFTSWLSTPGLLPSFHVILGPDPGNPSYILKAPMDAASSAA
ncbi:hypothetical protein OO006_01850 [Prosthecochloris sp. SCSIO W1101]|uniref:hypothetical protein n=1 Tax=Prosthecochloris sp. SCSIO W1101 TaxID=2992242 RepID=UPI00223E2BB3|nr:hypothetical protein [Prosthecochloris sp. SCSIO W1101]UZJ41770.1 hypothetical protein OO006_01850 [Prosthecochloris sp. SCSIO W1101]